jgi:biopolymer transport protein ExbB
MTRLTLLQIMIKGGPIMWPIALCSVLALAIILERLWYFYKTKVDTQQFLHNVLESMKHHDVKAAIGLCQKTRGAIGHILQAGITKHNKSRERIKEAIEEAASFEVPKLERYLSALATIAHISPLLGLLGTVTGLIRSFQGIEAKAAAFSPVNPSDLAGGIWEALLTTVAGLMVAIPCYFLYNYLVSRVNAIILEMEKAATELVNFLAE